MSLEAQLLRCEFGSSGKAISLNIWIKFKEWNLNYCTVWSSRSTNEATQAKQILSRQAVPKLNGSPPYSTNCPRSPTGASPSLSIHWAATSRRLNKSHPKKPQHPCSRCLLHRYWMPSSGLLWLIGKHLTKSMTPKTSWGCNLTWTSHLPAPSSKSPRSPIKSAFAQTTNEHSNSTDPPNNRPSQVFYLDPQSLLSNLHPSRKILRCWVQIDHRMTRKFWLSWRNITANS